MNITVNTDHMNDDTSFQGTEFKEASYTKEESKIYNKRIAPLGSVFLKIAFKKGKTKYTSVILSHTIGMSDETKQSIYERMWENLKKKYNL